MKLLLIVISLTKDDLTRHKGELTERCNLAYFGIISFMDNKHLRRVEKPIVQKGW